MAIEYRLMSPTVTGANTLREGQSFVQRKGQQPAGIFDRGSNKARA